MTSPFAFRTERSKMGDSRTPLLANTVYAPAISSGDASYDPSAIAGVAFTDVIPADFARSATLSYPTSSATFTVALFSDMASA